MNFSKLVNFFFKFQLKINQIPINELYDVVIQQTSPYNKFYFIQISMNSSREKVLTFIQIYALCMRMEFTASWHFNFCNTVSEYLHAAININWTSFVLKNILRKRKRMMRRRRLNDINTKVNFRCSLYFCEW